MTIDLTLQLFIFDLQLLYFYSLAADYPGKYIYNLLPLVTSFSKNDYETATYTREKCLENGWQHI